MNFFSARFVGRCLTLMIAALAGLCAFTALGESRFPQPQFDSGYAAPAAHHPPFTALVSEWADVALLALALGVTVWLVHRVRSRRWILVFAVVCLAWFGFIRQGCFCPIGAIQNVAVAAVQGGGLAWSVVAFFALPLISALLFGRVFCASVCPLGVLQEIFIIRPQRVPRVLDVPLRLIPLGVLAFGLVYTLNGAGYLICRTDPFVGFFRRSAPLSLLLAGMAVVLLGMVVARPYCRYFCPYGVLLEWCSRLAWKPVRITPQDCVNCRLCVGVCPVDAIEVPREALNDTARAHQFRRFTAMLLAVPLLVAGCAGTGWLAGAFVAKAHPLVETAEALRVATPETEDLYPHIEVFKKSGVSQETLDAEVAAVTGRFRRGSAVAGAFIGLVVALRILGLSRLRTHTEHEANRFRCVACGRCYPACPKNAR
ncbi:MAG: 4Fe-4S binding protein [Kiritimatiellaeota bacterium]|nr:4Fe-4S binding protein [Kiritimatiellota bacterium]